MTWKTALIVMIVCSLVVCASCMPGKGSRWVRNHHAAGFFAGVWHGIIAAFSLIFSIFSNVSMYECYNTGFGYDLGYFIGIAGVFGGGTRVLIKKK